MRKEGGQEGEGGGDDAEAVRNRGDASRSSSIGSRRRPTCFNEARCTLYVIMT